jgi:hypothetical protein
MPRLRFDGRLTLALLALAMALFTTAPADAGNYKLTDLGTIGAVGDPAGGSIAGITSSGAVVGTSQLFCPSSGICGGFVWKPDAPNAITGSIVKIPDESLFSSCYPAIGINDSGQVLCSDKIWNGGPDFTGTSFTHLDPLATGFASNLGAINNLGDVVGEGVRSLSDGVATWWPSALNPRIGVPMDTRQSIGSALNNNRVFAGRVLADDGHHATRWTFEGLFFTATTLNAEFQHFSDAHAINDGGVIVGYVNQSPCPPSCTSFLPKPLMWAPDEIELPTLSPTSLSTLGGVPYAINSFADAVGYADELVLTPTGPSTQPAAVLWTGGTVINLNTATQRPPGWHLKSAYAINDAGQIAGIAVVDGEGSHHGFLLTPDTTPPDTTPPTTTATLTPAAPNGNNGWYKGPVSIQLSATDPDNDSSSLQTTVQVDGGPLQVTTSLTVSQNGSHTVEFWSADPAGNTEAKQSVSFKIDSQAPITTASVSGSSGPSGWFTGSAQVTLSATDAVSGVDKTYYTIDGGATQTYSGPFTVSGDGAHTVAYWSVDLAGNEAAHGSLTARIDTTAPTIAVSASPSMLWSPNNKLVTVTVSGTLSDGASGIDPSSAVYTVTDSYGLIQPTGPVTIGANGSFSFTLQLEARRNGQELTGRVYIITISAKDLAGNLATVQVVATVVHDQR